MSLEEQQIRDRLGIPSDARYVLILDQSAHMDWDWLKTFEQYFSYVMPNPVGAGAGVNQLLTEAVKLLQSSSATNPYYYSICEMGFFRKFISTQIENRVDMISILRGIGSFLRIVGGGITSPDCLLPSGEGLLRNYLLGKLWLAETLPELLPLKHCWLPDDFGQDPELPVAVKAMGMTSISFSRLPGIPPSPGIQDTALEERLVAQGVDFNWIASDRSSVFTHWMTGPVPGYYQGGSLATSNGNEATIVSTLQDFLEGYNSSGSYLPPFTGAPANYMYMPLDEDFMYPIADLLSYVATWNSSGQTGGVYAVEASYDDFVSLVLASGAPLQDVPYNGTPYWTGFYASRPELKIKHYGATRLLLAAEALGLVASGAAGGGVPSTLLDRSYWARVSHGWHTLVPSTHHDYICGTATDSVTNDEQIPVLDIACQTAKDAVDEALITILEAIRAGDGNVVILNPSGAWFQGIVELPAPVPAGMQSIIMEDQAHPVQPTLDGGLVFRSRMSSLAYGPASLSTASVSDPGAPAISPTTSGATSYTLSNEHLTVTVSAAANWGIESISDRSGALLRDGAIANDLVFYVDEGNIYQFGNELPGSIQDAFKPATVTVVTSGDGLGASILESGQVRVRLQTVVAIDGRHYTREYCLAAGEPLLRMTTTGAAPKDRSIMAAFPLVQPVDSISYGTPCHWTARQPHEYWPAPVFCPTHHFVLPHAKGIPLAAMYHGEVPAWSFDQDGVLLGCVLRNTPNGGRGASGSDDRVHTVHYALRASSGLSGAATGQPLSEALNYSAPAIAGIIPSNRTTPQVIPHSGWIASVSSPGFILAAKPGDVTPGTLILRIYQPSNSPQLLTVTLGHGQPSSVVAVTALEDPITSDAPEIQITPTGFTIQTATALNTVQVSL